MCVHQISRRPYRDPVHVVILCNAIALIKVILVYPGSVFILENPRLRTRQIRRLWLINPSPTTRVAKSVSAVEPETSSLVCCGSRSSQLHFALSTKYEIEKCQNLNVDISQRCQKRVLKFDELSKNLSFEWYGFYKTFLNFNNFVYQNELKNR